MLEVGDEHGAAIIGAEIMVGREHGTNYPRKLLVILSLVIHEDSGNVLGVKEIAHCAEGNHHHAVVVVVAALHLVLIDADDLEAHAVDADALSQGLLTGEQLALRFVADHDNSGPLELVFFAQTSARRDVEAANAFVDGIDASEEEIGVSPRVVLDGGAVPLVENRGDTLYHRHFVADVVDIREFQSDLTPCFGAAGLQ